MPSYTGTQIITQALRDLGVLDPVEAASAEAVAHAEIVGTRLIDRWRTKKLTISGVTANTYSLTSGTQSYTIGTNGTFNQDWPTAIERWSVIPDDDAADPLELDRGRPLTWDEWQAVRVKSYDAAYPQVMYYDRRFGATGLGACLFSPVPDNNDVDVVLYCAMPQMVSLVAGTTYVLRPGLADALIQNLGAALAKSYGKRLSAEDKLEAKEALGDLKRSNYIPRVAPTRAEFAIGRRSRTFNIRTDS